MSNRRSILVIKYIVLSAGAIIMLFPFYWALSTSFRELRDILFDPYSLVPRNPTFANYLSIFNKAPFGRYLLNSLIVASATAFLQITTASLSAFAFARMKFRGREIIFIVFLATMMIPQQILMIPQYIVVMRLGMGNSYAGLVLPYAATAISIFFLRQFFRTIPKDLEDAAIIDGCGPLRILLNVFIPLAKPAIATLSVFAFMWSWNNYFWPLLIIDSTEMRTIQLGLALFRTEGGIQWGEFMAGTVVATLPILIVYFIAQKQFIKGITLTGMKG